MSVHRGIELVLHIAGPPGPVHTGGIPECNRELVTVCQDASDLLPGTKRHRDLGFRSPGIQHPHLEFETLVARSDPDKVASGGVAGCASPGTVEVLFAPVGASGLQIGDVHPFASAFLRERGVALGMNKGSQAGNLLGSYIKMWHALFGASTAHNSAYLVSAHIGGHQLGPCEIGPGFSAVRIAAMTEGAIFPEERAPTLDQSRRVGPAHRCGDFFDSAGIWRGLSRSGSWSWSLRRANSNAHQEQSRQPHTPAQRRAKKIHPVKCSSTFSSARYSATSNPANASRCPSPDVYSRGFSRPGMRSRAAVRHAQSPLDRFKIHLANVRV